MTQGSDTRNPGDREVRNRLITLDALRFFAALWVAAYHFCGGLGRFDSLKIPYANVLKDGSLPNFLGSFVRLGFIGVPIFFVISGYVIYQSGKSRTPREFYISRFSRLAPAYFFSLFGALLIGMSSFGFKVVKGTLFDSIVSASSLISIPLGITPVQQSYWTLWPEICFYTFFSITLFFPTRLGKRWTLVMAFIAFWLWGVLLNNAASGFLGNLLISQYASYFALGVLLAIAYESKAFVYVAPIFILAFSMALINLRSWILNWDSEHVSDYKLGIIVFILAVALIFLSPKVGNTIRPRGGIFGILGRLSYALYLLQEGIGIPLTSKFVHEGLNVNVSIVLGIGIVTVLAFFFTAYFENPLISFIKKSMKNGVSSS